MSDFRNIKADCTEVADALEPAVSFLERQLSIWEDDPESTYFDPDWTVNLDHQDVQKIVTLLRNIRGIIWHLGNNPEAVAFLVRQHMAEEDAQ